MEHEEVADELMDELGHELRNPLAAIRSSIDLLQEEPSDELRRRIVDILDRQASQMEAVLETLLGPATARAAQPEADAAPQAAQNVCRRVLLVEDEPDLRLATRVLLEQLGHQVRSTADAGEALSTLDDFPAEVVLCDLGLGGEMSGLDVARAIRRRPQLGQLHLVALTGYNSEESRRQAAQAGFDEHLVKPVDRGQLLHALRRGDDPA